jgi:hypothetical protein
MSNYVVLCDCDGDPNPRIIAWIDDDRPNGGRVRVDSNTGFTMSRRNVPNIRGGVDDFGIQCYGCRKAVRLSDARAGEVLDKIQPIRDTLEVRGIPALDQPAAELSDDERTARFEAAQAEISAQLRGDRRADTSARRPVVPDATLFETRYVIPFAQLCYIVTKLSKSR